MNKVKITEPKKVKLSHKEVDANLFLEVLGVYAILALIVLGAYYIAPGITGFVTVTKQSNYTDAINLDFKESAAYEWTLANPGDLRSVKIDGSLIGNGTAKIYIWSSTMKYLLFDSAALEEKPSGIFGITAFAVKEDQKDNESKDEDDKYKDDEDKDKGKDKDKDDDEDKENTPPEWISDETSFAINTTVSLNFLDYFADADNDTLAYSASSVSNISISVDSNIITFTPQKNIEETTDAIIAASDGKNITYKTIELMIYTMEKTEEPSINETKEKSITISLEYDNNNAYDANNDGIESLNGVIDITPKASSFNWEKDSSKLCARYEIYSLEDEKSNLACFGSNECCSLVDLESSRDNWDESLYIAYGDYGATKNNLVFGQVLYADYDLSSDIPHYEVVYSKWANLTANFVDNILEFEDVCIDSCKIEGNETSYKFIIELENTELNIDRIDYIIEEKATNEDPLLIKDIGNITLTKNENFTIGLSKYFIDNDGDALNYNYLPMENMTLIFENNLAKIIPGKEFTGAGFTYIEATDSYGSVISNVFRIDVKEKEAPGIEVLGISKENEILRVEFKTTGISNLTIAPIEGSSFTELYYDNLSTAGTLEPLSLLCGDFEVFDKITLVETDNSGFILGNSSKFRLSELLQESLPVKNIYVEDYSCNGTSYYKSKIFDTAKDIQEFRFGDDIARVTFAASLPQKFEIRDINGAKLAEIDSFGNMQLKGALMEGMLNESAPNSFVLYSSSSEIIFIVENPTGSLYLKGALNQNQTALTPTPNSFIIKNSNDETIAYASNDGNLFLKGILSENAVFS